MEEKRKNRQSSHLLWVRGTVSDLLWDTWSWNRRNIILTKWQRFPDSASVYFHHLLCPVLLAAVSAKQQQNTKRRNKKQWTFLLWGFWQICADSCKIKAGSHSFQKIDLFFHPESPPGHRKRTLLQAKQHWGYPSHVFPFPLLQLLCFLLFCAAEFFLIRSCRKENLQSLNKYISINAYLKKVIVSFN